MVDSVSPGAGADQASSEAPAVEIAAILAEPGAFLGKAVRVTGDVVAMCEHKRDWFALAPAGTRETFVRVLTGEDSRVPEDAIGKVASAEGTVDLVEISEAKARHFAKSHELGDPEQIDGPEQQIVVRASHAEFR